MPTDTTTPDVPREIEETLLTFLHTELLSPDETVDRDDDLLEGEVLDSVAVLRLASFVEEELGITLAPSDFVVENFRTVAVLAAYVSRVRAEAGAGPGTDR